MSKSTMPARGRGKVSPLGIAGAVLANLAVLAFILLPLLNAVIASVDVAAGQAIWANFASVFSTAGANAKGTFMIPALANSSLVSIVVVAINLVLGAKAG